MHAYWDLISIYWGHVSLASFRLQSLHLASLVTDSRGVIAKDKLDAALSKMDLSPALAAEQMFFTQFIKEQLAHIKKHYALIKKQHERFRGLPYGQGAQDLIRHTLMLDKGERFEVASVRKAVLSSCFMPLRQNVGSCFATAPVKLIQTKSVEQMMIDLHDLLYKGYTSRFLEDKVAKAPLCLDWVSTNLSHPIPATAKPLLSQLFMQASASFDKNLFQEGSLEAALKVQGSLDNLYLVRAIDSLENHPLLRAYEYTIASYADYKTELSQYNLYMSLALSHEIKGGVGDFIYQKLNRLFQGQKEAIDAFEEDLILADAQINMTQALLKRADNIDKARRYQRQLEANLQHKTALTDEMQKKVRFERKISTLYVYLKDQYTQLFKEHYQEVYSPSLYRCEGKIFADSPAGFRLLYKGRYQEPHLWEVVAGSTGFVNSLKDFFLLTMKQVISGYEWQEGEELMEEIITELSFFIESQEFMEACQKRIGASSDKYKTPWSYISGGSLPTLMGAYFTRGEPFEKVEKLVTSPIELLTFFLDTLKELPYNKVSEFEEAAANPMLASSPTHAFSILPGLSLFRKGWEDTGFTYTWIRDHVIEPQASLYKDFVLSHEQSQFLCSKLEKALSVQSTALSHREKRSLKEFSDEVRRHIKGVPEQLMCHYLRQSLPLFDVKTSLHALEAKLSTSLEITDSPFLTANEVFALGAHHLSPDTMISELEHFVDEGWLPHPGLVVGDTNWPIWFFAFVVNPLSCELELWRTDYLGLFGEPMDEWQPFISEHSTAPWILYTDPGQYGFKGVRRDRGIRI